MDFGLGELSASELNAAIDDTNFPKNNNNVENGKKNDNDDGANGVIKPYRNGSSKHDLPLLNGAAFNSNYSDSPSTPKTPRTTTTPGMKCWILIFNLF